MSTTTLSITTKIEQFDTMLHYSKRKHTKFIPKVSLALSNPALSYTADPAIIEIRIDNIFRYYLYYLYYIYYIYYRISKIIYIAIKTEKI